MMREEALAQADALHLPDPIFAGAIGSDLQRLGLERARPCLRFYQEI